jgi:glycosyltransferase involved in cell wall biosynthesis
VVASRTGGLPSVVEEGVGGYLAEVGDIDAMAERGIEILSDQEHWRKLSAAARAAAVERFGVDRVVPQYESYYNQVLAGSAEGAVAAPATV